MNFFAACRHAFALALVLCCAGAAADVNDTPTERRLSIAGSARAIVLPRGDWALSKEQRRPGDTAAYYMLASEAKLLVFSVYIDKTTVCNSAASCLEQTLTNPEYKDAKEMQKSEIGPFRVAQFFLDNPRGTPIKQAQLVAGAYVGGQWYDVHISKSAKERPDMAALLEFLQSLSIK